MTESTVKEVTVFIIVTFLNETIDQIHFLKNLRNAQHAR